MAVIETKEIDDFSTLKELKISSGGTGYSTMDYGAIPTISISDLTLGNITSTSATTYTLGAQGSHSNAVWTTTGTGTGYNYSGIGTTIGTAIDQGGKISLKGEKADVDINGKSLKAWMAAMEERLNWMQPNVELEKEWDDLRKLGERYRKLEKKCKEKAEVWNKLKKL